MKKFIVAAFICMTIPLVAAGCQKKTVEVSQEASETAVAESSAPAAAGSSAGQPPAPAALSGTVAETMTTAGYTYVNVDTGAEKVWAAAPAFEVKEGDRVSVPPGAAMPNYYSKSLDRTFDVVYFVGAISVGDEAATQEAMPALPPGSHPAPVVDTAEISFEGIAASEGELTVGELFEKGSDLAGTVVTLRGKVVKFSTQIMGKNWLHLQDGTNHQGKNDLTVTTMAVANKGDTVVVRGKLAADKDFGAGYLYDFIIEDAEVTPQ